MVLALHTPYFRDFEGKSCRALLCCLCRLPPVKSSLGATVGVHLLYALLQLSFYPLLCHLYIAQKVFPEAKAGGFFVCSFFVFSNERSH